MNKNIISAVVSGGLFLLLILLVSFVDVQTVPATGMEMGLSHINFAFSNLIGVNPLLYKLTTVLGIFLILVVVWFGLKGLMQLIHRKSLLKVDREILTLGGLYVVLALVYVFFEKVIINYRPIIMEGETEAEASFPSSHTMLVCVVMGSAIMLLGRYIKDPPGSEDCLLSCDCSDCTGTSLLWCSLADRYLRRCADQYLSSVYFCYPSSEERGLICPLSILRKS